jgi:Sulfatase
MSSVGAIYAAIFASRLFQFAWGKTFMFDLMVDPTEEESTHGDTQYDDVKTYMESRIPSYWMGQLMAPDVSDSPGESAVHNYWNDCHYVCPWVENTASIEVPLTFRHKKAPNVVFILVDDWGYNDVGYRSSYNSWATPTVDRLAREGIILNNYFTHASCSPSRGALMTGRMAIRLGLWAATDEIGPELPLSEVTLAQELKSAGYKTNLVGKWHLYVPYHTITNALDYMTISHNHTTLPIIS